MRNVQLNRPLLCALRNSTYTDIPCSPCCCYFAYYKTSYSQP